MRKIREEEYEGRKKIEKGVRKKEVGGNKNFSIIYIRFG